VVRSYFKIQSTIGDSHHLSLVGVRLDVRWFSPVGFARLLTHRHYCVIWREFCKGSPSLRRQDLSLVVVTLVIPAASHRRERHLVGAALPVDLEPTLGNREVWSPVHSGRRRLDEVRVGEPALVESVQEVHRHRDVVLLGVQRALAVDL